MATPAQIEEQVQSERARLFKLSAVGHNRRKRPTATVYGN